MLSLDTLPNEVILQLTKYIHKKDLPSVILTCKKLQEYATPRLYGFVQFWRDADQENDWPWKRHQFLGWKKNGCIIGAAPLRVSDNPTEILSFPDFVQTMEESEFLRSRVLVADFRWNTFPDDDEDSKETREEDIFALVDLLQPSLRSLRLSPGKPDLEYGDIADKSMTSLNLRHTGQNLDANVAVDFALDLDDFYKIFCVPSLRQLIISFKDDYHFVAVGAPQDLSVTSNIIHLTFSDKLPTQNDLQEILTWPIALQSFHIAAWNVDLFGKLTALSLRQVITLLLPQANTLEELFIASKMKDPFATDFDLLVHFSALKRLGFVVDAEPIPDTYQCFPPTLEKLQLKVNNAHSWVIEDTMDFFANCLYDIAHNKDVLYPRLEVVALWIGHDPSTMNDPPNLEPHYEHIADAFEEAGIQFLFATTSEPPLFGQHI